MKIISKWIGIKQARLWFRVSENSFALMGVLLPLSALFSAFSFWNASKLGFLLLVRCLYHKQNDAWLLWDMDFLFSCWSRSLRYIIDCCVRSWDIGTLEVKFHSSPRSCIIPCLFLYNQYFLPVQQQPHETSIQISSFRFYYIMWNTVVENITLTSTLFSYLEFKIQKCIGVIKKA